jgi:AbiU2
MSDDIQKFTLALFRRLSKLDLLLLQCKQLYSSKETVSILNETAGLFFRVVQEQFMDSILLGISNITDKEKTLGHRNLTIRALPQMMAGEELKAEVARLCKDAIDKSSFICKHRNKRIAHFDETFHLDIGSIELDPATFQKVESSLDAIHSVLNLVSNRCFSTILGRQFIGLRRSADELVVRLKKRANQAYAADERNRADD